MTAPSQDVNPFLEVGPQEDEEEPQVDLSLCRHLTSPEMTEK